MWQNNHRNLKGVVLSDLHVGAHFSSAKDDNVAAEIDRVIEGKDLCVLNGDILEGFDLADIAGETDKTEKARKSLKDGEEWLRELFDRHPNTNFVLVGGNHDGLKEFDELYTRLSNHPDYKHRVNYYPSVFEYGNAVFLHGDMPLHDNKLYRDPNNLPDIAKAVQPDFANELHRLAAPSASWIKKLGFYIKHTTDSIEATLNKHIFATDRTTPALVEGRDVGKGMDPVLKYEKAEHVFVGHTHQTYSQRWDDFCHRYHNSGGTVKGSPEVFNPLEFEIDTLHQHINDVRPAIDRDVSNTKTKNCDFNIVKTVRDMLNCIERIC